MEKYHVLVVEDDNEIANAIKIYLQNQGYDVYVGNDGIEGLEIVEKETIHLAIVDIMMPRLDGYQTCALIKNSQNYQNIPVIMLSSKDGLFDQAKGRVVGSDEYLTKPFSKDELLNAIRNHVSA